MVQAKEIAIAAEVLTIAVVAPEAVVPSIVVVMTIELLDEAETGIKGTLRAVPVLSIAALGGITTMAVTITVTIGVINALDPVLAVLRIRTVVGNMMMMITVVEMITQSSSPNKTTSPIPMLLFPLELLLLLFLVRLLLFSLDSSYSRLWAS